MVIHKWHDIDSGRKILAVKKVIPVMWGISNRGYISAVIWIFLPK